MFIDIENLKSPIAVENLLMSYKKGRLSPNKKWRLPREKITPDVCFEVLRSTNYAHSIKDMLERIYRLSDEEQIPFKEVVLSTFDRREQPLSVQVLGELLAKNNNYRDELDALINRADADFLCSAAQIKRGRRSEQKYFNQNDVFDCDKLILTCDYAKFNKPRSLPAVLDLSACDVVRFEYIDDDALVNVEKIIFAPYSMAYFSHVKSFPQHLDLSNCSGLNFSFCEFAGVKQLDLAKDVCVRFDKCFNIPLNMAFDKFKSLRVDGMDCSFLKEVYLQKGRI